MRYHTKIFVSNLCHLSTLWVWSLVVYVPPPPPDEFFKIQNSSNSSLNSYKPQLLYTIMNIKLIHTYPGFSRYWSLLSYIY